MGSTQIIAEPGIPQIVITREFDAPRELVFRAYTEPELLVQWWGPRDHSLKIERYEVRDGGKWRFVATDADGTDHGFHGVFHGDPSPDGIGIVQTFEYEAMPGSVALDTATFEERGGATVVRTVTSFQSVEDRGAMVASGMEDGARESYQRLVELLARQEA